MSKAWATVLVKACAVVIAVGALLLAWATDSPGIVALAVAACAIGLDFGKELP